MNKKVLILWIAILTVCFIAGGLLIYSEILNRKTPEILQESHEIIISEIPDNKPSIVTPSQIPTKLAFTPISQICKPSETAIVKIEPASKPITTIMPQPGDLGTIAVLGKTFPIKIGVDEKTLQKNIGWMESSAAPGADGACVIMGHRNTQFRILKGIQKSDSIIITKANGDSFRYEVKSAQIVDSDKELKFEATDGKLLILVTCYPFYYEGHAPQKFVLTALIL